MTAMEERSDCRRCVCARDLYFCFGHPAAVRKVAERAARIPVGSAGWIAGVKLVAQEVVRRLQVRSGGN